MTTRQRTTAGPAAHPHPAAPGVDLARLRAEFAARFDARTLPPDVTSEATTLGGRPARRVTPAAVVEDAALLYLHGGGYVAGSADTGQYLAGSLASRTRVAGFALGYRLAPEHPHPAAVDDAVAAYQELLGSNRDLVVAGDSAGGGLALALLLTIKERGLPMPLATVVFSPFVDLALTGESLRSRADHDPVLTPQLLALFAESYLHGCRPGAGPAGPLHADVSGLPPLLIQVGTREILLDDAVRLARCAADMEVDVILDVVAGMTHVFQSDAGVRTEADDALDRAGAFLRHALTRRARSVVPSVG